MCTKLDGKNMEHLTKSFFITLFTFGLGITTTAIWGMRVQSVNISSRLFGITMLALIFSISIGAIIFGLRRYKSRLGGMIALAYLILTFIACIMPLYFYVVHRKLALMWHVFAIFLTLPWSFLLTEVSIADGSSLFMEISELGVYALLNTAVIYFTIVWINRLFSLAKSNHPSPKS